MNVQLLGVGTHFFSYTLSNSCATFDSVALMVEDFPQLQIGLPDGICVNQNEFQLVSNYGGGHYSG